MTKRTRKPTMGSDAKLPALTKELISGRVLSNDGERTHVQFEDGAAKYYKRDVETKELFHEMFPVGGTIQVEKISFSVNTREELFNLFERCFGKPDSHGVAMLGKDQAVLIGMIQVYGPVSVFCTEGMSHPFGATTNGFALLVNDQTYSFALDPLEIEDALSIAGEIIAGGCQ